MIPPKNSVLKIVILGDGGVGKSCLMNRFVCNKYDDSTFHTIGVEFMDKEMNVGSESFVLQIWDTAGQERFKSLRTPFYRGTDICLLTYAVNDTNSFNQLSYWRKEFIKYADIKDPPSFPFLVVGSKVDCKERTVGEEEVRAWCRENCDLPYIETSSKDCVNVEEAFLLAVETWLDKEVPIDPAVLGQGLSLKDQFDKKSKNCC